MSEGLFVGKRAFVTGGSGGIGRAVCTELARQGADVAFTYHSNKEAADETHHLIGVHARVALPLQSDLANPSNVATAVERVIDRFGRIDVLIHAAGAMGAWRETVALGLEEWDRYIAVDLSGAFYLLRAAVPHLRRSGDGRIVAVSSIAAQMCQARNAQGAAAKAGLEALIRVLAKEEARYGIRANAVAVGLTDTDMGRAAMAGWGEETSERIVRQIPLRRIGRPEEVARIVCFLAGPDGAYITGKVLQVDGGQIIAA
jgi:NAD(P)-dependent dehydrogenase (short-subunit alcohol dehydrogenase family)